MPTLVVAASGLADAGLADAGLALLRVVVGLLIVGHAVQKAFGWMGGDGLAATAAVFDRVGYRPGRPMVLLASLLEAAGAVLLILGVLTPVVGSVLAGVMLIACSVHWRFGIWAAHRGFELPLTFGVTAATLALTGAGGWSVDHWLGAEYPGWVAPASLSASCLGALALLLLRWRRLAALRDSAGGSPAQGGARVRPSAGTGENG